MSKITHINAPGLSASIIEIREDTTPTEINELAWQMMCNAHPREAHEYDPERFWRTFHQRCPGVTREQMNDLISRPLKGANA